MVNRLDGFAQITSNAYSMAAKELPPPSAGEEKGVQESASPAYPRVTACTVVRVLETFRGHKNIYFLNQK